MTACATNKVIRRNSIGHDSRDWFADNLPSSLSVRSLIFIENDQCIFAIENDQFIFTIIDNALESIIYKICQVFLQNPFVQVIFFAILFLCYMLVNSCIDLMLGTTSRSQSLFCFHI